MDCTQRYELIRPILQGNKTVRQVAKESGISQRTLYRYLSRFTESGGKIESLADKSHAAHSHPNSFTDEHRAIVIDYKQKDPHKSCSQIAKALTDAGILQISDRSVLTIGKTFHVASPFLSTDQRN